MATNICSRSRTKYVKASDLVEQYSLSKAQVYRILSRPEMAEAVIKMGDSAIRIDQDKFFEISQKIYRWERG